MLFSFWKNAFISFISLSSSKADPMLHLLEPASMCLGKVKADSFSLPRCLWQTLVTFHEKFMFSLPQSPPRSHRASRSCIFQSSEILVEPRDQLQQWNESGSVCHLWTGVDRRQGFSTLPFSACQLGLVKPRVHEMVAPQYKRRLELKSPCARTS